MTILPPELPSFQSFVESTKFSLCPKALPEKCSSCANSDEIHAYELVDLHRHSGSDASRGLFWASSPSKDSSTTCDASSSCSCGDADDQTMFSDETATESGSLSPSSVDSSPQPTKRRAYATKKKYLTEQQRYEIVCRVMTGEKQARVARDYGVTRAAVCYLLKHHSEIMHRVLTLHANCCHQRAMDTSA